MPAPDEQLAFTLSERGAFIVPTPLVSRGRPAFDDSGPLSLAPTPGGERVGWHTALGGPAEPWLAVHAGVGPKRLLVNWAAPRSAVAEPSSPPHSYRIESSANSTRGGDGDFRLELRVTNNTARARTHVIDFDGQSWVRITFERVNVARPVGIERLELHDASDGTDDVWLILGDDLAREGLAPHAGELGVAELIHERYPGYSPALIDETRSGERPEATLARLAELLETHPHARGVAIAYGVARNDDASEAAHAQVEATALTRLVSEVLADGRRVTIARSPRRGDLRGNPPRAAAASLDRAMTELDAREGVIPGPDLRRWFAAHPDQLDAEGRPTLEGRRAMQRLWVEALDVLYVPQ